MTLILIIQYSRCYHNLRWLNIVIWTLTNYMIRLVQTFIIKIVLCDSILLFSLLLRIDIFIIIMKIIIIFKLIVFTDKLIQQPQDVKEKNRLSS